MSKQGITGDLIYTHFFYFLPDSRLSHTLSVNLCLIKLFDEQANALEISICIWEKDLLHYRKRYDWLNFIVIVCIIKMVKSYFKIHQALEKRCYFVVNCNRKKWIAMNLLLPEVNLGLDKMLHLTKQKSAGGLEIVRHPKRFKPFLIQPIPGWTRIISPEILKTGFLYCPWSIWFWLDLDIFQTCFGFLHGYYTGLGGLFPSIHPVGNCNPMPGAECGNRSRSPSHAKRES